MQTGLFWVYTVLWQWKRIWYPKSNKLEAVVICCWQPHLHSGVAWLTGTAGFPWMSLPLGSAVGFTLLSGRRHLLLNISLGPVLLQTVSQVKGLDSLVVSYNKSVEIPFWFPTQTFSLKVKMELKFMLSYLPEFQCHSSFCHCSFKGADSPWRKQRSRRKWSRNPLLLYHREKSSPGAIA